jgi:hypothetical protein
MQKTNTKNIVYIRLAPQVMLSPSKHDKRLAKSAFDKLRLTVNFSKCEQTGQAH